MARNVIVLLGTPVIQTEDGAATEAITPGQLVQGVTSISKHSTLGGVAARTFALERDEMGEGIDDDYAIDDYVKVGSFHPGQRVYAWLASGQNIVEGAWLESNGDGDLKVQAGAGIRVGRAMEAVDATAGRARVRTEVY